MLTSLASSLQGIDTLEVGQRIKFPVWGLRWTQTSVSRKWQFKNGSSIFKLVMDLHRNRVTPEGLTEREPLRVYARQGPDGWGLYSNDNRRPVAHLMYPARRRRADELYQAWCVIHDRLPAGVECPTGTHYEGNDGLSIGPRLGLCAKALHRWSEFFGHDTGAILPSDTPLLPAVDLVLERTRLRSSSLAQSELSLRIQSAPQALDRRRVLLRRRDSTPGVAMSRSRGRGDRGPARARSWGADWEAR